LQALDDEDLTGHNVSGAIHEKLKSLRRKRAGLLRQRCGFEIHPK
jgi:hypothetical protein